MFQKEEIEAEDRQQRFNENLNSTLETIKRRFAIPNEEELGPELVETIEKIKKVHAQIQRRDFSDRLYRVIQGF